MAAKIHRMKGFGRAQHSSRSLMDRISPSEGGGRGSIPRESTTQRGRPECLNAEFFEGEKAAPRMELNSGINYSYFMGLSRLCDRVG